MAEKVLIVHEDAAFVARIKVALAAVAPDIQVANALSAIRAEGMLAQEKPDVLVVDAELADRDGYEFAKAVKSDPGDQRTCPSSWWRLWSTRRLRLKARSSGAAALLPSGGGRRAARQQDRVARSQRRCTGCADRAGARAAGDERAVAAVAAGGRHPRLRPCRCCRPQRAGRRSPSRGSRRPSGRACRTRFRAVRLRSPATARPLPVSTAPAAAAAGVCAPGPAPMGTGVPQPVKSAGPAVVGEGSAPGSGTPHIDDLLRLMLERGGSDLHITVGSPPGIRQRGEIVPVENMKPLSPRDTMEMILGLLSEEQRRRFETELELDFAYSIPGVSRFRANVFQQRNSMGAVFRVIPIEIPTHGGPRPAEGVPLPRRAPARPRAGDRSDRLG